LSAVHIKIDKSYKKMQFYGSQERQKIVVTQMARETSNPIVTEIFQDQGFSYVLG